MAITFQLQESISLKDRNRLKAFLNTIVSKSGKISGNISYIFCSDEFLLDINNRFLSHDYYTDIITFDLSENPEQIDAEILISVDRVRENARAYGETFQREMHRVIFHGLLHLTGFNDKSAKDKVKMKEKENELLHLYFK